MWVFIGSSQQLRNACTFEVKLTLFEAPTNFRF
jgi:hypothetical protein